MEPLALQAGSFVERKAVNAARLDRGGDGRVTQRGRDDAVARQDAQIAVGDLGKAVGALAQQLRRPALRDDERQRLLVDGARLGHVDRLVGQQLVHLVEVAAVPSPHAVAQADDLAVAGHRAERHRVEEVEHQPPAGVQAVRSVEIGANRRRHHLAQLVACRARAAAGRVPELLDLGGERAAAEPRGGRVEVARRLHHHRERQPVPLDRRVVARPLVVEQVTVLDEQQHRHHRRRDGVEVGVLAVGVARHVDRLAVAVEQLQPGLGLLAVDGIEPEAGQGREQGRLARLRFHAVAGGHQPRQRLLHVAVAEPDVVGAGLRQPQVAVRARLDLVGDALGDSRKEPGLELRVAHFRPAPADGDHRHRDRHQPRNGAGALQVAGDDHRLPGEPVPVLNVCM